MVWGVSQDHFIERTFNRQASLEIVDTRAVKASYNVIVMQANASLVPDPLPQHVHVLAQVAERIEASLKRLPQRGLVVVQLFEGAHDYRLGFTPQRNADVPHLMSMGLPEEAAISLLEFVRTYEMDREAAVLVTDRKRSGEVTYSFVRMKVSVGLPKFSLGSGTLR